MKQKLLLLLMSALLTNGIFAQAKKPTLMVVPSDVWCSTNGYMTEYDNQGNIMNVPDYQTALQTNMDLKLAIAKINDLSEIVLQFTILPKELLESRQSKTRIRILML